MIYFLFIGEMASVLILAAFLLSLDLVTLGEKVNSTKKDTTGKTHT